MKDLLNPFRERSERPHPSPVDAAARVLGPYGERAMRKIVQEAEPIMQEMPETETFQLTEAEARLIERHKEANACLRIAENYANELTEIKDRLSADLMLAESYQATFQHQKALHWLEEGESRGKEVQEKLKNISNARLIQLRYTQEALGFSVEYQTAFAWKLLSTDTTLRWDDLREIVLRQVEAKGDASAYVKDLERWYFEISPRATLDYTIKGCCACLQAMVAAGTDHTLMRQELDEIVENKMSQQVTTPDSIMVRECVQVYLLLQDIEKATRLAATISDPKILQAVSQDLAQYAITQGAFEEAKTYVPKVNPEAVSGLYLAMIQEQVKRGLIQEAYQTFEKMHIPRLTEEGDICHIATGIFHARALLIPSLVKLRERKDWASWIQDEELSLSEIVCGWVQILCIHEHSPEELEKDLPLLFSSIMLVENRPWAVGSLLMSELVDKPIIRKRVWDQFQHNFPLLTPLERMFILSQQMSYRHLPIQELAPLIQEIESFLGSPAPQTEEEEELYWSICLSGAKGGSVTAAEKYVSYCKISHKPRYMLTPAIKYLFRAYAQEGRFDDAWKLLTDERPSFKSHEDAWQNYCIGLEVSIRQGDKAEQNKFLEEMKRMDTQRGLRESVRIYAQGAVSLMKSTD